MALQVSIVLSELIEKMVIMAISLTFMFISVPNIINVGTKISQEYYNLINIYELADKLDKAINQVLLTNEPFEAQITCPENVKIRCEGTYLIIECQLPGHEACIRKAYPIPIRLIHLNSPGLYVLKVSRIGSSMEVVFMEV